MCIRDRAIREELQLTGSKFGCGRSLCGACTMHLNGQAIRSCIMPLSAVAGQKVTTIESFNEDSAHAVQQSWIENNVPQCGYCQPGQIMQAIAFLNSNEPVNEGSIAQAMSGNICRCGTYPRIQKAILQAAQKMGKSS